MNILVAVKTVPDPTIAIRLRSDRSGVDLGKKLFKPL